MTTLPATPVARKRRRKTRTKRVNHRPPIIASTLNANNIELFPGKEHLVCPDCNTWCPITGMQGTPKLVPHDTKRAGTPNSRRCVAGSDRKVVIDVAVGKWRTELVEAVPSTKGRRATKVLPKPKSPQPPAVSQIEPAAFRAQAAGAALLQHRRHCAACKSELIGRDGKALSCRDGERLASTFLRLLAAEPRQRRHRELLAEVKREGERDQDRDLARTRRAEWRTVLPKVEAADAQRAERPDGDAPTGGREIPLEPQDSARFDARQAELGRRYASRG